MDDKLAVPWYLVYLSCFVMPVSGRTSEYAVLARAYYLLYRTSLIYATILSDDMDPIFEHWPLLYISVECVIRSN